MQYHHMKPCRYLFLVYAINVLGLSQKKVIYTLQGIFLGKTLRIFYIANDVFAAVTAAIVVWYTVNTHPLQF